jgi:hypothetical protein
MCFLEFPGLECRILGMDAHRLPVRDQFLERELLWKNWFIVSMHLFQGDLLGLSIEGSELRFTLLRRYRRLSHGVVEVELMGDWVESRSAQGVCLGSL